MLLTLWANIATGTRLALLRPVHRDEFTVNVEQVVVLFVVGTGLGLLVDHLAIQLYPSETLDSWTDHVTGLVLSIVSAYLIAAVQRQPSLGATALVVWWSMTPIIYLAIAVMLLPAANLDSAPELPSDSAVDGSMLNIALAFSIFAFGLGWMLLVGFRSIRCVFETPAARTLLLMMIVILVAFIPDIVLIFVG
jgi:hypothetical protein